MSQASGFSRIAFQIKNGVKTKIISPTKVHLTLSGGFPYEAFNSQAQVKPWHILALVEACRAQVFSNGDSINPEAASKFLHVGELEQKYMTFQGSATVSITHSMHDYHVPKCPIFVEKELVQIGTSSFNIYSEIFDHSGKIKLASCGAQSVLVDRNTRRSTPLPDWWREKYQHLSHPERALKVIPEKEPLSSLVKTYKLRINFSDADVNLHANWSNFLKYALDAIAGCLHEENQDTALKRKVKSMQAKYLKEGDSGSWLDVRLWNSPSSQDIYHCNIVSADSKELLCYVLVEFYPLS